jgi:hypothetical protein
MTALTLVDAVLKFFVSRVNHGMFPPPIAPTNGKRNATSRYDLPATERL